MFQYKYVEATLDDFARKTPSLQFKRSYRKFKFLVAITAYCDFREPGKSREQSLAWAWEEVAVAFKGYGEPILNGVILQMWTTLHDGEKAKFLEAVYAGFDAAEEMTGPDTTRKFTKAWREKPWHDPAKGFSYPTMLPVSGDKLREWCIDEGEDIDEIEYMIAMDQKENFTEPDRKGIFTVYEGKGDRK